MIFRTYTKKLGLLALLFSGLAHSVDHGALMSQVSCAKEMVQVFDQWKVTRKWRPMGPTTVGSHVFYSPTQNLGEWVILRIFPDSTSELQRYAAQSSVRIQWHPEKCLSAIETSSAPPTPHKEIYSDQDLKKTMKHKTATLIYAWSPHMNYSVRGVDELQAVAKKMGFRIEVVLDPNADKLFAAEIRKEKKWPKSYLRVLRSTELDFRNMQFHYPTKILVRKGQFISPMIPGYEEPLVLEKMLRPYLTGKG